MRTALLLLAVVGALLQSASAEVYDPCTGVTCLNGATAVVVGSPIETSPTCVCLCPAQFSGEFCEVNVCTAPGCLDVIPPVLVVPPNVAVECNANLAPSDLTGTGRARASDNCNNVTIMYMDTRTPVGNHCPITSGRSFLIRRTFIAVDQCGNNATATQLIFVDDTLSPVARVQLKALPVFARSVQTSGLTADQVIMLGPAILDLAKAGTDFSLSGVDPTTLLASIAALGPLGVTAATTNPLLLALGLTTNTGTTSSSGVSGSGLSTTLGSGTDLSALAASMGSGLTSNANSVLIGSPTTTTTTTNTQTNTLFPFGPISIGNTGGSTGVISNSANGGNGGNVISSSGGVSNTGAAATQSSSSTIGVGSGGAGGAGGSAANTVGATTGSQIAGNTVTFTIQPQSISPATSTSTSTAPVVATCSPPATRAFFINCTALDQCTTRGNLRVQARLFVTHITNRNSLGASSNMMMMPMPSMPMPASTGGAVKPADVVTVADTSTGTVSLLDTSSFVDDRFSSNRMGFAGQMPVTGNDDGTAGPVASGQCTVQTDAVDVTCGQIVSITLDREDACLASGFQANSPFAQQMNFQKSDFVTTTADASIFQNNDFVATSNFNGVAVRGTSVRVELRVADECNNLGVSTDNPARDCSFFVAGKCCASVASPPAAVAANSMMMPMPMPMGSSTSASTSSATSAAQNALNTANNNLAAVMTMPIMSMNGMTTSSPTTSSSTVLSNLATLLGGGLRLP